MIDFSFPPDVEGFDSEFEFMDTRVRPEWEQINQSERRQVVECIVKLRKEARNEWQLMAPICLRSGAEWHLVRRRWRGVGRGCKGVDRAVVLNAQAPDEEPARCCTGALMSRKKYLKPLCEGTARSCLP